MRVGFVKNVEVCKELADQHIDIRDPRYANVIGLLKTQQEHYLHSQRRDTEVVVTGKNTWIAPFVNSEECEYLVIEDSFPNGRPRLEESGA